MNGVNFGSTSAWAALIAAILTAGLSQPAVADPPSAADEALFARLDVDADGQISSGEVPADQLRLFARLLRRGDANGDKTLSRDEFLESLVPSSPEKPIEAKLPASPPQADAIRWLLLTMDTNRNSLMEEGEVPESLERVFNAMSERLDGDKNGTIDRRELYQGNRPLAQIAGRYVASQGIDAAAELKKLEQEQGTAAQRFEAPPARPSLDNLSDPKKARELFVQLDGNHDGRIEKSEMRGRLQNLFPRLVRLADRDDDGLLTEREFLAAAQQFARRQARRAAREMRAPKNMPADNATPAAEAMPAEER